MIIYGENHFNPTSVEGIRDKIRKRAALGEMILATELVPTGVYDAKRIRRELAECAEGKACDPRINKDIFELADEFFGVTLIGIDLPEDQIDKLKDDLPKQFSAREAHMVATLRSFSNDMKRKTVVLIGDAHLRCTTTKALGGPSKIHLAVLRRTLDAQIVRADKPHREVE